MDVLIYNDYQFYRIQGVATAPWAEVKAEDL
jgi:hypothetical protein